MLVVILRRDRIARTFAHRAQAVGISRRRGLRYPGSSRRDRSIRRPGSRVVTAPWIAALVAVASAHALVVLTVSHDLPIRQPLRCGGSPPTASSELRGGMSTQSMRSLPRRSDELPRPVPVAAPLSIALSRSSLPNPRSNYRGIGPSLAMRVASMCLTPHARATGEASRPRIAIPLANRRPSLVCSRRRLRGASAPGPACGSGVDSLARNLVGPAANPRDLLWLPECCLLSCPNAAGGRYHPSRATRRVCRAAQEQAPPASSKRRYRRLSGSYLDDQVAAGTSRVAHAAIAR